jgi:hypothetical protein
VTGHEGVVKKGYYSPPKGIVFHDN